VSIRNLGISGFKKMKYPQSDVMESFKQTTGMLLC